MSVNKLFVVYYNPISKTFGYSIIDDYTIENEIIIPSFDPESHVLIQYSFFNDLSKKFTFNQFVDILIPQVSNIFSSQFGLLYNYFVFENLSDILISGWSLPSQQDFIDLIDYADSLSNYESFNSLSLNDSDFWTYTDNFIPTNSLSFNLKGSGVRFYNSGLFGYLKVTAGLWSKTLHENDDHVFEPYCLILDSTIPSIDAFGYVSKIQGFACRPRKNSTSLADGEKSTYTGNDGKVYETICINGIEWLAQNLCETKYQDLTDIPFISDNNSWLNSTSGACCYFDNDSDNL